MFIRARFLERSTGVCFPARMFSPRKVKAVTEALCGQSFSASSISAITKTLGESLRGFSERRFTDPLPYLILDARYERVRGVIGKQAVLAASPDDLLNSPHTTAQDRKRSQRSYPGNGCAPPETKDGQPLSLA
jgi:Transposase, Mutator family